MVGTEQRKTPRIELLTSKSGTSVPRISGVYLHSMLDPKKEAEEFAQRNLNAIKESSSVVILGLGCGHHILETLKVGQRFHRKFSLTVIEPYTELISYLSNDLRTLLREDLFSIFCPANPVELFSNRAFLEVLLNSPKVIPHRPSFDLHRDYFNRFLAYRIPENEWPVFKENLEQVFNTWPVKTSNDFLLKAFHALLNEESETGAIYE